MCAGLPTLAPSFLSPETKVWIQSENGILGMVRRILAISCDSEANSNQGPYPTEDEVDPYTAPFTHYRVCANNQLVILSTPARKL
jgi:acyl CoA:acetate/3-ketoacid CoA transferase beta subunit